MDYNLRSAEMVTSHLEIAGTWRGWNLCFYLWLNHTPSWRSCFMSQKLSTEAVSNSRWEIDCQSVHTQCSEALPLISCTVNEIWSRHSLHASSFKALFSWLDGFSCRSMAGNILHHGFYGGQRATFSQSRKLDLCRDRRWFIPNTLTFIFNAPQWGSFS